MFQSSIYTGPLQNNIFHAQKKKKGQLKLASTVCGVKGQYSNVKQDRGA